jgi:hypothetical protein
MKRIPPGKILKALTGEVLLARVRLAKVEGTLASAKEQVQATRQRRKAAKLAARRAKKRFRLIQEKNARAKVFLAQLESQLAQFNQSPAPNRPRGTTGNRKAIAPRRNPAAAPNLPRLKTVSQPARRRHRKRSHALVPDPALTILPPVTDSMEVPITVIPRSSNKATAQIVRRVEEIFTGEKLAEPSRAGKIAAVTKNITGAKDVSPPNQQDTP